MKMRRITNILVCVPVLTAVLAIMSIPFAIGFAIAVCIGGLFFFVKERWALPLVTSVMLIAFLCLEIGLRIVDNRLTYYRPHEKYKISSRGRYYKSNVVENQFPIAHGDLYVVSNLAAKTIVEPRVVTFHTDSLGFRNFHDYADQSFVLIGDSFGVGTGTTQEDTLSEVLTNEYGIPVYNASYPTSPYGYTVVCEYLTKNIGTKFRAIILFFEGNDFPSISEIRHKSQRAWYLYIGSDIRHLESYRFLFGLTRRAFRGSTSKESQVTVFSVGGKDVGFLNQHIEVTKQSSSFYSNVFIESYRRIRPNVALFVFIPTKYRVYYPLIKDNNGGPLHALPNSRRDFLQKMALQLDVPFVDLTPHLIKESKDLLKKGEYTYWRDDTHWNANGMKMAADVISSKLNIFSSL